MESKFPVRQGPEIAIIEAATGTALSHEELADRVSRRTPWARRFSGGMAFLGMQPSIDCVVDLLALIDAAVTTALVDPSLERDVVHSWVEAYRPELVIGLGDLDRAVDVDEAAVIDNHDAILLATSGSTGSPKFVRLSLDNLLSNARQIASALAIEPDHRGFAHLPLFYSYGLSILTSHLIRGASVVITGSSAIRPEFWSELQQFRATSLPGVPYHFEMYRRMKLVDRDLPHLRDVTQAGGRLNPERIREFHDGLAARGIALWVMYGQTEATARISVLPADELSGNVGSVGYALPGGRVDIAEPDGAGSGEVIYSGPNVMLGYAESRSDVGVGDVIGGCLATGDLGRIDDQGRLWITGRTKRIAKVFGTRVNLDDVERRLAGLGHTLAAVSTESGIDVYYESDVEVAHLAKECERLLAFPARTVRAVRVTALPTTPAGKISYQELSQ
jgi:acyl-CoA synthetase (AMP-forming)/AMP-acid ligase II